MEFITDAVFSGFLYDMLKHGIRLSANNIKEKLRDWVVDDDIAQRCEIELGKLQLSDDMSESFITKKLGNSTNLLSLLKEIKPSKQTTINQAHTGSGDNVAGDKITNY